MADRPKRKAIPDKVKLEVVLRQEGRCPACGERLGLLSGLNFDHRPAIINRPVNEDGTDYVPPQLDPEHIEAIHIKPCHDVRTNGPGGEKRITTAGSDKHIARKNDRLQEAQAEFRERLLAKGEPRDPPERSEKRSLFPPGRKLQSRGFEKRQPKS